MVVFLILLVIAASIILYDVIESSIQKRKREEEYQKREAEYRELETAVLSQLGFRNWDIIPYLDEHITVKSRQALEKYDDVKFFKDDREKLAQAETILRKKGDTAQILADFLENNEYKEHPQYNRLKAQIKYVLGYAEAYRIEVTYITSAGNNLGSKEIIVNMGTLRKFKKVPSLLMTKGEHNKYLKEQEKGAVLKKQHDFYDWINSIISLASDNRDAMIIKGSQEQLDNRVAQLVDLAMNDVKKIKALDSGQCDFLQNYISYIEGEIQKIINKNLKILQYYESPAFLKIKETCEALMSTQRDFNEYINEKVQSISQLFGTRVVRNETVITDEYNYIRPYKKTISPFNAEVSAAVYSSAENKPMEYIVKYFYPNKAAYPEQIQKLYHLVEELETLRDAKQIIENYKAEYQQYLGDVPDYIMENDEAGFYARLGFANIDEAVLTVEYKFSYTSNGGMAQRSFTVPMTEENIAELIKTLESKLTASAFAKEQRNLMTKKLREHIKTRDNFTCCICGNSTHVEPNLLLEIDHILPVSKGGCTVEDNLQTLCWKCNRAKSDKIIPA